MKDKKTNTTRIIECECYYTGGGIYLFVGSFADGTFFFFDGDMFDTRILDTRLDISNNDHWQEDFQQAHLIRDLDTEKEGAWFALKLFRYMKRHGIDYPERLEREARHLCKETGWR